jgi:ubiquinone/menaquinone biosynthesis C-methylase UbiE
LKPGDRLLDVGCGPGSITADLAELVAPGSVVALDQAAEVLLEAHALLEERGLSNVNLGVGDIYDLDFDDDAFDVVHAHQVLQHLSDPVAAMVEMKRVARPGGLVAVRDADYRGMQWFPLDERLDLWLSVYTKVARANGAEPDAGRELLSWALKAGFSEVVPSASVWCFAEEQSRQWWSELWAERIVGSRIAEQAVSEGFATRQELSDMADGFRNWASQPDSWWTVLHGEIIATA